MKEMKKSWIVNSIAHSPICGLKGSVIGIYSSEEAAKAAVKSCIETWRRAYEDYNAEVDFDKMAAWYAGDHSTGCRWFITPIETPQYCRS